MPDPERAVVAWSPLVATMYAGGELVAAPELPVEACSGPAQAHPVTTGDAGWEVAAELVAVLLEKGLVAAVVLRPPDVLRAHEHRAVYRRVADHRDVEGLRLSPLEQRVRDPVPPQLIGAVEVHVESTLRRRCGNGCSR